MYAVVGVWETSDVPLLEHVPLYTLSWVTSGNGVLCCGLEPAFLGQEQCLVAVARHQLLEGGPEAGGLLGQPRTEK